MIAAISSAAAARRYGNIQALEKMVCVVVVAVAHEANRCQDSIQTSRDTGALSVKGGGRRLCVDKVAHEANIAKRNDCPVAEGDQRTEGAICIGCGWPR